MTLLRPFVLEWGGGGGFLKIVFLTTLFVGTSNGVNCCSNYTPILFQRAKRTTDVDVWPSEPLFQGEREGLGQRGLPLPPQARCSCHTQRWGCHGGSCSSTSLWCQKPGSWDTAFTSTGWERVGVRDHHCNWLAEKGWWGWGVGTTTVADWLGKDGC